METGCKLTQHIICFICRLSTGPTRFCTTSLLSLHPIVPPPHALQAAAAYLLDADGHVEALATDWAAAQQDGVQHAQEERVLRHKQKQAVLAKWVCSAVCGALLYAVL